MRTSADPKLHLLAVRLTEGEYQALHELQRQRGDRWLADTLRSCIPRLRLEPASAPVEVSLAIRDTEIPTKRDTESAALAKARASSEDNCCVDPIDAYMSDNVGAGRPGYPPS